MINTGNLFAGIASKHDAEDISRLTSAPGLKIERIVSTGQASPPGFWYDQGWTEWVILLSGSASLQIENEPSPRQIAPGDYLEIPAHVRHRVELTDATQPTLWLAIHYKP